MPAARETDPRPFQHAVPQATLDDLRERLRRTRWTDDYEGTGWGYGTSLGYLQELAAYWLDGYDWRAREAKLNQHPWFTVTIDGQELRFIHQRGKGPSPIPIVLIHGWPDSFQRYLKVLPLLADGFDVVVPALVGFPGQAGRAQPPPLQGHDRSDRAAHDREAGVPALRGRRGRSGQPAVAAAGGATPRVGHRRAPDRPRLPGHHGPVPGPVARGAAVPGGAAGGQRRGDAPTPCRWPPGRRRWPSASTTRR